MHLQMCYKTLFNTCSSKTSETYRVSV